MKACYSAIPVHVPRGRLLRIDGNMLRSSLPSFPLMHNQTTQNMVLSTLFFGGSLGTGTSKAGKLNIRYCTQVSMGTAFRWKPCWFAPRNPAAHGERRRTRLGPSLSHFLKASYARADALPG